MVLIKILTAANKMLFETFMSKMHLAGPIMLMVPFQL